MILEADHCHPVSIVTYSLATCKPSMLETFRNNRSRGPNVGIYNYLTSNMTHCADQSTPDLIQGIEQDTQVIIGIEWTGADANGTAGKCAQVAVGIGSAVQARPNGNLKAVI